MNENELEKLMLDYYEGAYDVLVCTTIIENGLDIPNVNTIMIQTPTSWDYHSFTSSAAG